jgi:hypothetical protein
MDFTLKTLKSFIYSMLSEGYLFVKVSDFLKVGHPVTKKIILRHDVDALPQNSLRLAQMEHSLGIMGTYYFRMVKQSFDERIIKEIASLGHEIGYHYESLATIGENGTNRQRDGGTKGQEQNGNRRKMFIEGQMLDDAYKLFTVNLDKFREIVPIETICMHGSPLSRFDNRDIWKKYDYRKLGIIGEASMDIDFTTLAYYTDTGRRWDGAEVSIRDKVFPRLRDEETVRLRDEETEGLRDEETERLRDEGTKKYGFPKFHSTFEMIKAVENGTFPDQAMLTVHPQRWNDAFIPWAKELVWQNIKNSVKWGIVKWKQNSYLTYILF